MTPVALSVLALVLTADPVPLTADRPAVELGPRPAHRPLVQSFVLKNTGPAPLTITDVGGGCGCFRHTLTERRLEPGKSADLSITIHLLAQPAGPRVWTFAVRYAVGGTTGEIPLKLTAAVTRDVVVEPAALMLSAEGEVTGSLTFIDRRAKPAAVTGVRHGMKYVTVTRGPAAAGRQEILVAVAKELAPGQYADEVCIDTDDPGAPEIRVPLRVVKKPAGQGVQAFPGTVSLRFATDQPAATSLLRLKDAGDRRVAIETAEADHPGVTAKWAAGPDKMATVRVTVDRDKAALTGVAVVAVKLSGPAAETILIPVSWGGPAN